MLLCLWVGAALAEPAAWQQRATSALAPGPGDLVAARVELGARISDAHAVGRAGARLHNAWTRGPGAPCSDPGVAQASARIAVFGGAWRDSAQRVRIQAQRARELREAPTVRALVDGGETAAMDALLSEADAVERRWREAAAWLQRWGPPRCDPAPQPEEGLPAPAAAAADDPVGQPVAVWLTSDALACPSETPVAAGLVLVEGDLCVQSAPPCSCAPAEVHPGAILGPET